MKLADSQHRQVLPKFQTFKRAVLAALVVQTISASSFAGGFSNDVPSQTHIFPKGTFLTNDVPGPIGNLVTTGACASPPFSSPIYYGTACSENGTGQPIPLGSTCFTPVDLPLGANVVTIGFATVTTDSKIGNIRVALYASDNDGSGPGSLDYDLGTVTQSIAPVISGDGYYAVSFGYASAKFPSGTYNGGAGGIHWLAIMNGPSGTGTNAEIAVIYPNSNYGGIHSVPNGSNPNFMLQAQTLCTNQITYGAFPATAPYGSTNYTIQSFNIFEGLTNQ